MSKRSRRHATIGSKKERNAQVPADVTQNAKRQPSGWERKCMWPLLVLTLFMVTLTIYGSEDKSSEPPIDSRLQHKRNTKSEPVVVRDVLPVSADAGDNASSPPSTKQLPALLSAVTLNENESVFDHCSSQPYREAAERCASFAKDGSIDKFPPNSQYVVRCHSGSMQRNLDEAKINEEWRKRSDVVQRGASAKLEADGRGGAEAGSVGALFARLISIPMAKEGDNASALPPIDDALSLTLLQHEIVEAPGVAFDTLSHSVDPSSHLPWNSVYLGQVLHGGVSPATMVVQSRYMRASLKLTEAFAAVEQRSTREALRLMALNIEDMVSKAAEDSSPANTWRQKRTPHALDGDDGAGGGAKTEEDAFTTKWKRELLAALVAKGRIRINPPAESAVEQDKEQQSTLASFIADLVSRVTVHPDTILAELGTGASTLLYTTCPPDPFDLSTVCLGSDTVRVFLASAVVNAPHIRLSQGYGFPTLPPATVTHVLSHGIGTVICEQCMCGHIAEALRLLRPGGRLSVWMLRTGHHANNADPAYFDGSDFGSGVGIIDALSINSASMGKRASRGLYQLAPQALATSDAFFFMDKCRREHGIYLSPYVDKDSLSINVREPAMLYSACFERDGFFSVSLLRSSTPWDAFHHPNPHNAGARPLMTPAEFIALPTHAQRLEALAKHADYLPQMLNVEADLCRSRYGMTTTQRSELAKRIVAMQQMRQREHENGPAAAATTTTRKVSRQPRIDVRDRDEQPPSIALKFLPQSLQAWVVDLILSNQSAANDKTPQQSPPSRPSVLPIDRHRPLPMAWFKRRLLNDMVLERSARINNASRLFTKCKRSKHEKYWCYREGQSAAQRARNCDQ